MKLFVIGQVHVFFANEQLGAFKCYQGAMDAFITKVFLSLLSHRMPLFTIFRKSTPPQILQVIVVYYLLKYQGAMEAFIATVLLSL